jgi:long-chain acyl-CoA synthetase
LKSYKLGPYKLDHSLAPYPVVPVFHALDEATQKYPGQTAILFQGHSINYAQLAQYTNQIASALTKLGVKKADRVCIFMSNCMEFVISDWAVQKVGAAVVPTSILRTEQGLFYELASSGAKVIFCQDENLERVLAIRERCELEHIIVTSSKGFNVDSISYSLPSHVYEFRKLLLESDPTPPTVEIDPIEDLCELAFTGGATGTPKGVMITHFNRYSCLCQGLPWVLKSLMRGFVGKASTLIAIPLFHAYGHYVQQTATLLGLRLILMPDPRDSDTLVELLNQYRPLFIPIVPTQLMRISQADLPRMNVLLMSGSAPLPMEISEAIKAKIGVPVSQGYGLTETSPLTHYNVSSFAKITGFMHKEKYGIGIPLPDTECQLLDPESGEEVPFGEPGELVLRGPQIMKGYWSSEESGLTKEGWLHTGDIAVMDEDGYFQLVDRIKDMVNVSGMKVYTTKVDDVLFKHPAVLMAAAFGVPDPEVPGSERVMAVIQLKESYKGQVTLDEIRDFCKENLPAYAVPKFVEFRDDMPLTVTEKVFKKALRDEAVSKMRSAQ